MKRLLLALVAFFALSSCSSGDNDTEVPTDPITGTFIKKTVEQYEDGTTLTTNFAYNGSKLTGFTDSDGENVIVQYDGDLISQMNYMYDGDVEMSLIFSYNNDGKLIGFKELDLLENYGYREVYVPNADGTISVTAYDGSSTTQNNELGQGMITLTSGGDLATYVLNDPSMSDVSISYDDKLSPFKNILGLQKIGFSGGVGFNTVHNPITRTENYFGSIYTTTTTYTYDTNGYPLTSSETDFGEVTTTQYFYE